MKKLRNLFITIFALTLTGIAFAKDIHVAIIDTGIDPTNDMFKGRLYIGNKPANGDEYGMDFSIGANTITRPYDLHGHGTHIAGIIAKRSKHAKLHILKYYNPSASGEENLQSTIKALQYAINLGVDIINYSSGGPEPSIAEKRLLDLAEKKGILIVSAAGNFGTNIDSYGAEFFPASYHHSNIITVGSHNKDNQPLPSSNFGKRSVDLFAPGHRILSTLPNHREGFLTGTSQATAFVSAKVANMMKDAKNTTVKNIKSMLLQQVIKKHQFADICQTGGMLKLDEEKEEFSRSIASQL